MVGMAEGAGELVFQLTPPRGGATTGLRAVFIASMLFQLTPPRGGATGSFRTQLTA